MICWKIRIFAYWTTPRGVREPVSILLWFAEKFVSLLIEQHLVWKVTLLSSVVICWKIRIFAYWTTPGRRSAFSHNMLWFAEKFVSLLIEQHLRWDKLRGVPCCDLLKNSYLCLLNNTLGLFVPSAIIVVICWKIRILAYWTTPKAKMENYDYVLWFAEKFVSLLIEQHLGEIIAICFCCCDLLKNSYLCLLNNTWGCQRCGCPRVVICWKIRIFAYWTTPGLPFCIGIMLLWFAEKFVSLLIEQHLCLRASRMKNCCDLLKNSYLCLLNNTSNCVRYEVQIVVICWKIRIFAYWTTPNLRDNRLWLRLWFAEKFVSLLIEQHLAHRRNFVSERCDLLKNSYLCLLNNTWSILNPW